MREEGEVQIVEKGRRSKGLSGCRNANEWAAGRRNGPENMSLLAAYDVLQKIHVEAKNLSEHSDLEKCHVGLLPSVQGHKIR